MDKNQELSIQTQQKFEFYILALVFTVLGLSIQTARLYSLLQGIFEVVAWTSLLISGFTGLSRMEWIPVLYHHHSKINEDSSFISAAQSGRHIADLSGKFMTPEEISKHIENAEARVSTRKEIASKIEHKHDIKYAIHKWSFVVGLFLLMVSRSFALFSG